MGRGTSEGSKLSQRIQQKFPNVHYVKSSVGGKNIVLYHNHDRVNKQFFQELEEEKKVMK